MNTLRSQRNDTSVIEEQQLDGPITGIVCFEGSMPLNLCAVEGRYAALIMLSAWFCACACGECFIRSRSQPTTALEWCQRPSSQRAWRRHDGPVEVEQSARPRVKGLISVYHPRAQYNPSSSYNWPDAGWQRASQTPEASATALATSTSSIAGTNAEETYLIPVPIHRLRYCILRSYAAIVIWLGLPRARFETRWMKAVPTNSSPETGGR